MGDRARAASRQGPRLCAVRNSPRQPRYHRLGGDDSRINIHWIEGAVEAGWQALKSLHDRARRA